MDLFTPIKNILQYDGIRRGIYFSFVTTWTVCLNLFFFVIHGARQFFGTPIDCLFDIQGIGEILNTYCWTMGTFSPKRYSETVRTMSHHQWFPFLILVSACVFYLPKRIWKILECKKLKILAGEVKNRLLSVPELEELSAKAAVYIRHNQAAYNWSFFNFVMMELLCFALTTVHLIFINDATDSILRKEGPTIYQKLLQPVNSRNDSLADIFPRKTICEFRQHNPNGREVVHTGMCVHPYNALAEHYVVFLWFWLIMLNSVFFINLSHRMLLLFSNRVRSYILFRKCGIHEVSSVLEKYFSKLSVGQFFTLFLIGNNIDMVSFNYIVQRLAEEN